MVLLNSRIGSNGKLVGVFDFYPYRNPALLAPKPAALTPQQVTAQLETHIFGPLLKPREKS